MSPFNVNVANDVRVHVSDRGVRATMPGRLDSQPPLGVRMGTRLGLGVSRFAVGLGAGVVTGVATEAVRGTSALRAAVVDRLDRKVADRAEELAVQIAALESLHRQEFSAVTRPAAPPEPQVDEQGIRARHERAALAGVGSLAFRRRAELKDQAKVIADAEISALRYQHRTERLRTEFEIERWWSALMVNEPALVMERLATAFEDNGAPAAPVSVDGGEVTLVVIVPTESVVPDRRDDRTEAGKLSLRKLSKSERNELYLKVVMGHLLATVKEAFAVAPAATSASVVVLRIGHTAVGQKKIECLVAGRWTRAALSAVRWSTVGSVEAARASAVELMIEIAGDHDLRPLKMFDQPGLIALVAAVDVDGTAPISTG